MKDNLGLSNNVFEKNNQIFYVYNLFTTKTNISKDKNLESHFNDYQNYKYENSCIRAEINEISLRVRRIKKNGLPKSVVAKSGLESHQGHSVVLL